MSVKEMGKCKGCESDADLNADGYCTDCAKKEGEGKGGKPSTVKLDDSITIVGPVPHEGEDQQAFIDRCMLDPSMMDDYPTEPNRAAACKVQWGKGAKPKPKTPAKPTQKAGRVLSQRNMETLSDAVGDMDAQLAIMELPRPAKALGQSARGKVKSVIDSATPEPADPQPSDHDHVLREAMLAAAEDRSFRDKMRKAIDAFDKADENEQLADDYRQLEKECVPTSSG